MTKSMWIAVSILLLLFAACGVFIVLLQKDEEQKNVQYFLTRNKLQKAIEYKTLSLSVSDFIKLQNVSVKLYDIPSFKNKTSVFIIHDYRETQNIPTYVSVTASNVRFKLIDIAHSLNDSEEKVLEDLSYFNPVIDLFDKPLYSLLLAGCNDIDATAQLEYTYQPDEKKVFLKTIVQDKCLGRWEASVTFKDITNAQQGKLTLALKHLIQKGDITNDLWEFVKDSTVTSLRFSYTETKFIQGYKRYIDTLYLRMPNQASQAEIDSKGIQKMVSYMSFSNAHRQRNTDIANTIAGFVKAPDTIIIQSKPGKEVPVKALSGDFLRRLTDTLLRLDVSVTLEKSSFKF